MPLQPPFDPVPAPTLPLHHRHRTRSHRSFPSLAPSTAAHSPTSEYPFTARSAATSIRSFGFGGSKLSRDDFRVLMEMQRVVYRGVGEKGDGEDEDDVGYLWGRGSRQGDGEVETSREEVEEFINKHFDADCLYESPLLTLHSSPLLSHALNLSHSLSQPPSLPSVRPRAMLNHAWRAGKWGWGKVWGDETGGEGKGKGKGGGDVAAGNAGGPVHATGSSGNTGLKSALKPTTSSTAQYIHPNPPGPAPEPSTSASSEDYLDEGDYLDFIPGKEPSSFSRNPHSHGHGRGHGSGSIPPSRRGHEALQSAFGRYQTGSQWGVGGGGEEGDGKKGEGDEEGEGEEYWWKAWDVRSVCGEINEMETYDGFHFGFIEHTLILSFLPHLLDPIDHPTSHPSFPYLPSTIAHTPPHLHPFPSYPHSHATSPYAPHPQSHPNPASTATQATYAHTNPAPPISTHSIGQTVLNNLLRLELHLHTIVEFNEAGKIVYVRDLIDLRDLWEGVVPFGRTTAWIGRRLGGVVIAGLGRLFFGPGKEDEQADGEHLESDSLRRNLNLTMPAPRRSPDAQAFMDTASLSGTRDRGRDLAQMTMPGYWDQARKDQWDQAARRSRVGSEGLVVPEMGLGALRAPDVDSGGEGLGRGD